LRNNILRKGNFSDILTEELRIIQ